MLELFVLKSFIELFYCCSSVCEYVVRWSSVAVGCVEVDGGAGSSDEWLKIGCGWRGNHGDPCTWSLSGLVDWSCCVRCSRNGSGVSTSRVVSTADGDAGWWEVLLAGRAGISLLNPVLALTLRKASSYSSFCCQWTDDTSMALCLAESLVECRGYNPVDQSKRYWLWYQVSSFPISRHGPLGKFVLWAGFSHSNNL